MKTETSDRNLKFLLGKLSEEENLKIEQSFFDDKKMFEDILIAENDLIDAYVAGNLSAQDRIRFENRLLLNPKQQQRVRFAKTLVNYVSSRTLPLENSVSPAKPSWTSVISRIISNKPMLSLAFAATAFIFFAGVIWLTLDKQSSSIGQPDEVSVLQNPQAAQANENSRKIDDRDRAVSKSKSENASVQRDAAERKTRQTKPQLAQKKETPTVFSFVLSPVLTRDGGSSQKVAVPANADVVKFELKVEQSDFSAYHAALETVEGNQVWKSYKIKPQKGKNVINVSIPAKLLKRADYILALKGVKKDGTNERAADYAFTIAP